MNRVGGISGGAVPPRRAGRAGGFGLPRAAPDAPESGAAGPAVAASPLGLLALQETVVEPPAPRGGRRVQAALDELRGLQLDLLSGAPDPGRLRRLAALAEGSAAAGQDPALALLLEEVSLRARLEIARHRARSASGM